MGIRQDISYTKFPAQGKRLGKPVVVCFHYDTSRTVNGDIVRSDAEDPWVTIIHLSDGRFVLATECMYSIKH